MAHLRGRVTTVHFRDDFTGDTVARLAPEGPNPRRLSYPFRGSFADSFHPGEVVTLYGEWNRDPEYGPTFLVDTMKSHPPTTPEGEATYLSGLIKGLSRKKAEELIKTFGGLDGVIEVAKTRPDDLSQVLGNARKVKARLRNKDWEATRRDVDIFLSLRSAGLKTTQVQELVRFFGVSGLRQAAQRNPYEFCQVPRIGFASAEKVSRFYAEKQGRPFDALQPDRLIYGLRDVVGRERGHGHVCVPEEELLKKARSALGLPSGTKSSGALKAALEECVKRHLVVRDYDRIYTRGLHKAESDVAIHLGKLLQAGAGVLPLSETKILRDLEGSGLSDEQAGAVATISRSPVSLLVGGPGRGKTRTLRSFLDLLEKHHRSYLVLAPTGKAAKRASEVTGVDCHTIHKACGLDSEDDVHSSRYGRRLGPKDRFRASVVIVDEASMVDLALAFEVIRRVKAGRTSLVLVGDPYQLPPVGPGQILRDLLASEVIPTAELTQVFRQEGGSPLVDGADAINRGELPAFADTGHVIRHFDPTPRRPSPMASDGPDPEASKIHTWLRQALVKYTTDLELDPKRDIQVYAPQRSGPAGIVELNHTLQEALNPVSGDEAGDSVRIAEGFRVRVGDKVIQQRNNYRMLPTTCSEQARLEARMGKWESGSRFAKEAIAVMNGQVGEVVRIDSGKSEVEIRFEDLDEPVIYLRSDDWRDLAPAYAISIHRSQGSEIPFAFLVLHSDMNPHLLNRPLIYTAWTRAKTGVAVFAPHRDLKRAVANLRGVERYTTLARRLSERSQHQQKSSRIRVSVT